MGELAKACELLAKAAQIAGQAAIAFEEAVMELKAMLDNHDSQDCDCDDCRKGRK